MSLVIPAPVKSFAMVLSSSEGALEEALRMLGERWGAPDHVGRALPFDVTDYYEREMGPGLVRRAVSFERLAPPERLVERKVEAMEVEDALRGTGGGRRANIDPGYVDLQKVVLASSKEGPWKIHLGRGVHADLVARVVKGRLEPSPGAFADFRSGVYEEDLLAIRRIYKGQLRGLPGAGV